MPPPASPAGAERAPAPGATLDLSCIVPLFNNLALSQAMVESLRATLPARLAHEIILIDDGSTDGTRAWLASLREPPFRMLLNERNLGFAATNNRAATEARGRNLVLLNNDLVLQPRWLEPMLAAQHSLGRRAGLVGNVQVDARTGAVDHAGIVFNLKAKPEHDRRAPSRWSRGFAPVRHVPAVTAACVLVDASLWRELGGFDTGYVNGGEDVDLCFRARAAGRLNAVALRSVVRHHVSASPGRKLRDEANSERLARRWGADFVACATRAWCREYLAARHAEPRARDATFVRRAWLHAVGLSRTPPPEAIASLNAALDLEFVRWRALLAQISAPESGPR
ncbi:glycosyltransferase [Opitutus sp. ER46]|uniref:glycosyltransferase family 2 protein n=1 Tax=Opitutus sp. ER46 TaxID=2161864 RepID=UPI000D30A580|nr:glycosyltransferase [Opitutus sp. ER46]PTX97726.1 hypothetical protein DB354_05445 [Opitutus sp. ER46]